MKLPGQLEQALNSWVSSQEKDLRGQQRALAQAYKAGKSSDHVSAATYVTTRLPATFAANERALHALAEALPHFNPKKLLDVGTGPGTATWAALARWPEIGQVVQCEPNPAFAALARKLNAESVLAPLAESKLVPCAEADLPLETTADLVLASYMLAEVPLPDIARMALRLWQRAHQVLVLLEPGTPAGFARLRAAREALLARGAYVAAPCTHGFACPIAGADWCHFKTRLQRSRAHMHAKQAVVPFEDEAFSYLVLSRLPVHPPGGRVVAPPRANKTGVALKICAEGALSEVNVASRDWAAYKRARKISWGDVWE